MRTTITPEDLRDLKFQLVQEIKDLLSEHNSTNLKKFLKSSEVMDMLQISPGTLQNLRINGTLPYIKIGGLIYYDALDIQKVLLENRVHHRF